MKINDLRSCIDFLEGEHQLVRINREVNREFELAGVAWKFDGGKAVLFEKVKGYKIPVVTGVYGNIESVAKLFGVKGPAELIHRYSETLSKRIKPKIVKKGPVKDVVITKNIDLTKILPIPWHSVGDAGAYITAGVVISKDIESGVQSQSIHRMQIKGPNKTGIVIDPGLGRHKERMLAKVEKMNKPLEIAVAIGLDPMVMFAANVSGAAAPYVTDKFEIAGALRGKPMELVKGETVDLEVPANAEIVIEGEILPNVRESEGPFAEASGYYPPVRESPVVKVKAIAHRESPIYQTILGGSIEHRMFGRVSRASSVYKFVKGIIPTVTAVNITHIFHAIVSMKKEIEGQQRNAMLATLTAHPTIKLVIVVDEDIDVFNLSEVLWAISVRFQGDKGIFVLPEARGHFLDPSSKEGLTAKVGIDATVPLDKVELQKRIKYLDVNISEYLSGRQCN